MCIYSCVQELWQNNALSLQFWCLPNAFILQVFQRLSACALFCHNSHAKVITHLSIYNQSIHKFSLHYVILNLQKKISLKIKISVKGKITIFMQFHVSLTQDCQICQILMQMTNERYGYECINLALHNHLSVVS